MDAAWTFTNDKLWTTIDSSHGDYVGKTAKSTSAMVSKDQTPPFSCRRDVSCVEGPRWNLQERKPFMRSWWTSLSRIALTILFISSLPGTGAAFINFDNCLDPSVINSQPLQLQFIPLYFSAKFDTADLAHNLNITIYGNVSGQATEGKLPAWDDSSYWENPNNTFGKIIDVSEANNYTATTLFSKAQVLTYTPYEAKPSQFCLSTVNASCPIGPAFKSNASDPYSLPGFTVAHDFYSSYAFATFATTVRVQSGDRGAPDLACISANITPDLGSKLTTALTYIPAAVLALVAIATVSAARFSPWSSKNPFHWTSNYGRDEDLLRLVTPGFGDCLQYIQFIVLAGSLSLNYPGYYQPVVSQASWSTLMFNQSFVSGGNSTHSLVDGIYVTNGTYGLTRMSQLVGMAATKDVWAGMAIWLCAIIAGVVILCQIAFMIRWLYRQLSNTQEEDLRSKNWPFTAGNVVRIVFNYFLLPIVSLSMFQLVVASRSPASVVAMAVVLLVAVICFAAWIFRLIFTTRPRAHLFDDLPTVLLYGPLYNTYSDDAAPFAFIPILLNFIRGVAIGAVQPSGIAQLILLAICEVILILTLHAFRPFQAPTSMNAYHTFFSVIRLVTTLLSVAFVPSLGVSESSKGWLGYAILLLHAIVLVFGFFLNSIQTLIEVCARQAGAGRESRGGLTKVFGMRQLSKRARRQPTRSSLNSDAAILAQDGDNKSIQLMGGRSRSLSASSAVLLNQQYSADPRLSAGFDQISQGSEYPSPGPTTPGAQTPYSYLPSGAVTAGPSRRPTQGAKNIEPVDPYYRPPRPRKSTIDPITPGARSRGSWTSGDWANKPYQDSPKTAETGEPWESPPGLSPNRGSITPAYLRAHRDDSDPNLSERPNNTDYAVRESDFYYGVRGPALSSMPTRRLKTGPADPMGPVSSATGWFRNIFGGKRKEKSKGFEVVRSTRAHPPMMPLEEDETSPRVPQEPYHDSPDPQRSGVLADSTDEGDDERMPGGPIIKTPGASSPPSSNDEDLINTGDPFDERMHRVSDVPPMLGPVETGGGIELPNRIGSKASSRVAKGVAAGRTPTVPRKSSRRTLSKDQIIIEQSTLSTVAASPPRTPHRSRDPSAQRPTQHHLMPSTGSARLPFDTDPSPERPSGGANSASSSIYPTSENVLETVPSATESVNQPLAPPQLRPDRPVSTGEVVHHLASDSIHPGVYAADTHLGSAAELVNDGVRRSGSTGRSDHRLYVGPR